MDRYLIKEPNKKNIIRNKQSAGASVAYATNSVARSVSDSEDSCSSVIALSCKSSAASVGTATAPVSASAVSDNTAIVSIIDGSDSVASVSVAASPANAASVSITACPSSASSAVTSTATSINAAATSIATALSTNYKKKRRDSSVNENTDLEITSSSSKRIHREQSFCQKWKEQYRWIEEKQNKAFCNFCQLKLTNNKPHLKRHANSTRHQMSVSTLKNQPKIEKKGNEFNAKIEKVKTSELRIIMFILQNNLPFSLISPIIHLVKNVASDSHIAKDLKMGKTKATETTKTTKELINGTDAANWVPSPVVLRKYKK